MSEVDVQAEANEVFADLPMRPDVVVSHILAGPRDELAERLARTVLELWERPAVNKRGTAVVRKTLGSRLATPAAAALLRKEVISPIAKHLDLPDAELRATLAASELAGLILSRSVLRLQGVKNVPVDELVAWTTPTLDRFLFGPAPR